MPKSRHPLQERAGELRKTPTEAEQRLWQHLRNRQVEGIKFRRQQPIEGYIVDFVSFNQQIVIELDGGQHADAPERNPATGFLPGQEWLHSAALLEQ